MKANEDMEIKTIKFNEPIGYIVHEPTESAFGVYHPISLFKRTMLHLFFGLKYKKAIKG